MNSLAERIAQLPNEQRAALLHRLQQTRPAPNAAPHPRPPHLPLSFAQERLWFLQQLAPDSGFYNVPAALRLSGRLDHAALAQAFSTVIRRHEVLRTVFVTNAGTPYQHILPATEFTLPVLDLRDWPAAEREAKAQQLAEEDAAAPFDLAAGPMLRARLLALAADTHWLLVTVHHIAFDGWSLAILLDELAQLYAGLVVGPPAVLPPLPLQYADYALWQRQRLQGERLARHLDYWRRQLADAPPLLALPTDRPRPPRPSYHGGLHHFQLPRPLTDAVQQLSRRAGATLFMTLLAVLNLLLARHSQQRDICVGTPVANRTRADVETLIGFFINTLVLRTDLTGNPPFLELLARIRQTCVDAQSHQDLPFEQLVEAMQPTRNPSHSPLFQVMLVLQNAPARKLAAAGLELSEWPVRHRAAKFDLTFDFTETADGLHAHIEYATDLFDAARIAALAEQFVVLLHGCLARPDARLSQLPLLPPATLHQLAQWNATAWPYADTLLHQLFERQAERTPTATAVVDADGRCDYQRLNRAANQLAHYLQAHGVGAEVRVAVCLPRRLSAIVAILGILKAGGAYVPLDPLYPQQRLANTLADCGAALVITTAQLAVQGIAATTPWLCLDAAADALAAQPTHNPPPPACRDHAAYLIYTSGSTGNPKGVVVSQRNAVASTCARFHAYAEPVSGFLLLSSLAFDSSVAGLFWTLAQGGSLCIVPEQCQRDPAAIADWIAAERPSHLLCLPALYGLLLPHAVSGRLASLRAVIVAGEACPPDLLPQHCQLLPTVTLHNEYGPTEASVWASLHTLQAADNGHHVPIGRPIANVQIHLLDADYNPVPPGAVGEVCIGGAGVARGYHQRPDLSAERFIPDPFAAQPGQRLYRSGDLARQRADGCLEFLGRRDHQVKIRGFRIELGEIEAALLAHPAVQAAAVVVRADRPDNPRLIAYWLGPDASPAITAELRASLSQRLPDYMVPAAFVWLAAFPLSANGKLDSSALPAPDASPTAVAAPQTPTEATLAGLWAELFGIQSVGRDANFFALGGHSLLAVRAVQQIQRSFGVELALSRMFETPSVVALAAQIDALRDGQQAEAAPAPLDWAALAQLDADIRPAAPARPASAAQHILLTGPTGFLGAFLLHELLRQTSATVHCLVRAADAAEASARLQRTLTAYRLWNPADASRIVAVCGDLSAPALGLTAAQYHHLSHTIDCIYHNGAQVSALLPYAALAPTNVNGTRAILRLACTGKTKSVQYVSTLSVFGDKPNPRPSGFAEQDFPPADADLKTGYAQSKWVAEQLTRHASARGLPVTIYRPALIAGDSRTGIWNNDDLLSRLIQACLYLQAVPDMAASLNIVPVDYVSQAIVALAHNPAGVGQCFHLAHPIPLTTAELTDCIRQCGYTLQRATLQDWLAQLQRLVQNDSQHPLRTLPGILAAESTEYSAPQQFSCKDTTTLLAASGLSCPSLHSGVWKQYIAYFKQHGYFAA